MPPRCCQPNEREKTVEQLEIYIASAVSHLLVHIVVSEYFVHFIKNQLKLQKKKLNFMWQILPFLKTPGTF